MSSESEKPAEWVEIVEPRTRERMYANLCTGECVWDEPEGVQIKRTSSSQWWELFDTNTNRFYYYNVASQKTVWHRPENCDIIPLAKLQTMKQTTVVAEQSAVVSTAERRSGSLSMKREEMQKRNSANRESRTSLGASSLQDKRNSDHLSSPQGRHSLQYSSFRIPDETEKYCKHSQPTAKARESGKSSDSSSLSSRHGYRKLQEGGSLRIGSANQNRRPQGDNFRLLQESSSSHNIPHIALPVDKYASGGRSPTRGGRKEPAAVSKHSSFDMLEGNGKTSRSLTRSGSFMNSPSRQPVNVFPTRRGSIEGGGGSDDSMHEKYFKSVENTPVTRRKQKSGSSSNSHKKHSSDSSPQSPISPPAAKPAIVRPSQLVISAPQQYNTKSSASSHQSGGDRGRQQQQEFDVSKKKSAERLNMDSLKHRKSPGAMSGGHLQYHHLPPSVTSGPGMKSSSGKQSSQNQMEPNRNSLQGRGGSNSNKYLSKQNVDRHNKVHTQSTIDRHSIGRTTGGGGGGGGGRRSKHSTMAPSDVEYSEYNGNISPLYSNWDQEMHDHLLPLQHYILEQAKLSGRYNSGDNLDSDFDQSDSHSEHSLSGHEPDNEDSDHSDGHGDYLSHYPYDEYGAYGKTGPSYYNFEHQFNLAKSEKDLEEVDAKLEALQDQIYSPVKNHPPQVPKIVQPPAIQKPIPQYPRPKPAPRPTDETQQTYCNFPFEGVTKFPPPTMPPPSVEPPLPKQAKQTLLQRFQENLSVHGEDKIAEMSLMKECDIEKFAQDNLNLHSKGIFRKKSSIRDMLSWTGDAISRPMLAISRDKTGKKMACELFKFVQIYMGDRKARQGMTLNSVAMDIIQLAVATPQLRDELYVQMCRQTTENPSRESLIRGWELLAICLSFIPPSPTFQPALLGYMNRHRDNSFSAAFQEINKWPTHVQISHYATIACRRLERIGSSGKKQAKKATEEEINHAREQIFRDSMFGNTLTEVMELQKDRFPERRLPWIQTTLSKQVLMLNGMQTEGIFRVPADAEEVTMYKNLLDRWEFPEDTGTMDAHTPAALIKLWYRELYDPLIPDDLYDECVQTEDPKEAQIIVDKLPKLNKLVLMFLINFLQKFAQPEIVANTKMDASNLAMVFAPNILRCTSDDPRVILENARKEMAFLRTLIQHMDTISMANIM